MYIEARMEELEHEFRRLQRKVEELEEKQPEKYGTIAEVAELLSCTKTHVSNKIKSGEIHAIYTGRLPRIPMAQFKYDPTMHKVPTAKTSKHDSELKKDTQKSDRIQEMRKHIFG